MPEKLRRVLSLPLVTFYGIGTILGAGIYALVGSVTKIALLYTPFAFLLASIIAFFTATSYAALASRYPYSAGTALYIRRAFNNAVISGLIGWLVVLTGVVSAGTMARGTFQYFSVFFHLPEPVMIIMVISALGLLAIWGIYQSVMLIFWMTALEIGGLCFIIIMGWDGLWQHIKNFDVPLVPQSLADVQGIILGGFIAFYAFIGFEDMVNTAEEVMDVQQTLPKAIIMALVTATILYALVTLTVVTNLSIQELQQGETLTKVLDQAPASKPFFSVVALISIMNGILVQIIMASRLIYGMAKQQNAPAFFANTNAITQTPIWSSLLVIAIIITLALFFPIETLARMTSSIILFVFLLINISLIVIQRKHPREEKTWARISPVVGALLIILFITSQFSISV